MSTCVHYLKRLKEMASKSLVGGEISTKSILLFGEVENIWADKYGICFNLRFNFLFEILEFGLKFMQI